MKEYEKEKDFAIAFSALTDFTFQKYKKALKNFLSLERAFKASLSDLFKIGWREEGAFHFATKRDSFSLSDYKDLLKVENLKVCFIEDDDYPVFLRNIYNPPPVFYYRGSLDVDWNKSLAVVGARNISFYSERILADFLPTIINAGINTVSGLAVGVDSLAHKITLENNGKTIAVLGSGLDLNSIYPYVNKGLAEEIVSKGGLVISEFPPKTEPVSYNFPRRNRIIAGLTKFTLVIEASEKSGSLITAKYALDEGREVLSVPADINKAEFYGNNNLIKSGAVVVLSPLDVLAYFGFSQEELNDLGGNKNRKNYNPENEMEERVIKFLKKKPCHIDDLSTSLGFSISELGSVLVLLELKGVVRDLGLKNYELL